MKRDNLNYGHMIHSQEIAEKAVFPPKVESPEVRNVVKSEDAFLRLVYAPDPVSKLPTGDLMYMVSDKANPEVKAWVLQNIQMDTSSAQNLAAPDCLTDDEIMELTRKNGESVESYASRVNVYFATNKRLVEEYASRSKSNVSSGSKETSVSSE